MRERAALQPVEPDAPEPPTNPVLERILDPLAREVYRTKLDLECEGDDFIQRGIPAAPRFEDVFGGDE